MKLISFLLRYSRSIRYSRVVIGLIIIAGVVGGACNSILLVLISSTLAKTGGGTPPHLWGFIGLCLLLPVSRFASDYLLIWLASWAVFELRLEMCRQMLAAPLRFLENLGEHRLMANLAEDVPTIINALVTIPILCMNFSIVVGCLIYLGWLSKFVLLLMLGFIAVGILTYQLPLVKGARHIRVAREKWGELFKHFQALTRGTKELKLHRRRRAAFINESLQRTSAELRRHTIAGTATYSAANSWGQILFFVVIGLLLFFMPAVEPMTTETLTGYVLVTLYIMTPLQILLNTLPNLNRANVAVGKIQELAGALASSAGERGPGAPTDAGPPPWRKLRFADVTHSYRQEQGNSPFTLGPVDLTFDAGELVFLIGGNGSGKTTFVKLFTGLYAPEDGEITLDGRPITDENRDDFRQHFAVVFSDFYLFEKFLGLDSAELDELAGEYLEQLQLKSKVSVTDGMLSTTELSQGQRKRLALLTAYLEDRSIYVFDEWAADQDPEFKRVFYYKLLPELKARGKTLLVISHDDRYYGIADRIIKLDYGKVVQDVPAVVSEEVG
jgi:putative ATP-binding cassette transporter